MTGLLVVAVSLIAATTVGLLRQRADRRRQVAVGAGVGQHREVRVDSYYVNANELSAAELGSHATLVQFSSAFCAPCRATRSILADVAAMVPGVAFIDVDAESHLDLVRRLRVTRTPTVLVVDRHGRVVNRAVGQPRKADVIAALAPALG